MAVASAGPYANHLHLAQTDNHASTSPLSFFTGWMPFWLPSQQHQSTVGTDVIFYCKKYEAASVGPQTSTVMFFYSKFLIMIQILLPFRHLSPAVCGLKGKVKVGIHLLEHRLVVFSHPSAESL